MVDDLDHMVEVGGNIGGLHRAACWGFVEARVDVDRMVGEYEALYRRLIMSAAAA
jgi:hypothetical protein